MCSWTCCPGNADVETPELYLPTSTSKPHLSTSSESQPLLPHPSSVSLPLQPHPSSASGRFIRVTDQELSKLAEGLVPQNTAKMTSWALKNFQEWMSNSNVCNPSDPVPEDFLQCTDPVTLNKHLSKFIVETRKSSGELYPPVTLHQLLCGILRYMRRDTRFKRLHGTLDSYFHKLHSDGVGRQIQQSEVISAEEEDQLWKKGVMGTSTPTGLQNAAFFVVGKMFCL